MSPRTRSIIYAILIGALGILLAFGRITSEQHDLLAKAGSTILDLASATMLIVAARNVTPDSWSQWRHAAYVMVAAVLAALTVIGWWDPTQTPVWLAIVDQVMTAVTMVVLAIATGKIPVSESQPAVPGDV